MARSQVGPLLREWRHRRNRSQLDVALGAGVSPRHLSFVETGRSRPSPELLLTIARHLDVPLRERNDLLIAAGHAPHYPRTPLDDDTMTRVQASLQRMLDAHDPYPGVVVDRCWNVVAANRAAQVLTAVVPEHVLTPTVNVFRVCLHPDGLAAVTLNFAEWARYLLDQLHRTATRTGDREVAALEREVRAYPNVAAVAGAPAPEPDEPMLLVPFVVSLGGRRLSMFTTLTTFGTPRDITLDELCVELFFPADDATDALLSASSP